MIVSRRRATKLIQGFALSAVLATGVAFALPLGSEATATASSLGTFSTGVLMIGVLGWAARSNVGIQRVPWATTLVVYALGMAVYALDPIESGSSAGDYPLAMSFGPIATAAQIGVVAVIAWRLLSELNLRSVVFDALWIAGSAVLIGWNLVGDAVVRAPDLAVWVKVVLIAQGMLFAALMGLLVALLPQTDQTGRRTLALLSSPAVLLAMALVYQARASTGAPLERGTLSDFLFPLAFGVGAAAVLESRSSHKIRVGEDHSAVRPLLVAALPLVTWVVAIALAELSLAPRSHLLGLVVGVVAILRVSSLVRENSRLIDRLRLRATHDHLTGLPNRAALEEIIDAHGEAPVALLLVDLDRFKIVNDTLGHSAGDEILSQAARRMQQVAGAEWTVVRLAGDEFVIIGADDGCSDLSPFGDSVIEALSLPFVVGDRQAWVSATVGVATTRDDLVPAELLEAADNALRRAKAGTRGEVLRVGAEYRQEARDRRDLESALRVGIDREELFCLYQPKVDLVSGRLLGVEALVRWDRPGFGTMAPDSFIDVAEETGLIAAVDEWVLAAATSELGRWNTLDPASRLSLSVNMSAWQLSRIDVHESVARVVAHNGRVDPDQITIEITETALIEAPAVVAPRLRRLRDLGVHLAIDDFGAGFTAIAYLVDFPVDEVKIDRALVHELTGAAEDEHSLAAAVIALGRAMDLQVIAEGVESTEQVGSLRRLGCERAQGFLFSKPVSAGDIDQLVLERVSFDVPSELAL